MPTTNQFWEYAREAILSASDDKTDNDAEGLLELARFWTQAALLERASGHHDIPADAASSGQTQQQTIEQIK
jgi:hypothetical protein